MNVLDDVLNRLQIKMTDGPSRTKIDKILPACDALYKKWLRAYRSQYVTNDPLPMLAFLALPADHAKALYIEPGSLVQTEKGDYVLVDGWKMTYYRATISGVDSKGTRRTLGADDFEPADIPREIIEIVRQQLLKKCPLLNNECTKEDQP